MQGTRVTEDEATARDGRRYRTLEADKSGGRRSPWSWLWGAEA